MGDGTETSPYTREDVLRLIEENGGTAEGLDLSRRWFEGGIDLSELDLKGVDLGGAHLKGTDLREAHFEETHLGFAHLEKARLKAAHLEKSELWETHLEGANLGSAHLEGANLRLVHLEGAQLVEAHFENSFLRGAYLEGAYFIDNNFNGADLSGAHLKGAYLHGAQFSTDTGLEAINWGDYILGEEKARQFDEAVDAYRRLKVWHSNAGYSDTAAKFYYREKEAARKSFRLYLLEKKDKKKSLKLLPKNLRHRFALQLSYWVFGHGEGRKRLLFGWIIGIIFVLAAAYYFWGSFSSSSFWDALYYSATSFSALGYGQWAPQPTGWAKGMGAAEAISGVFMMALLLVTFVRKWTR